MPLLDFFENLINDLVLKPFRFFIPKKQKQYCQELTNFIIYFRSFIYLKNLRKSTLGGILDQLNEIYFKTEIKEKEEIILLRAIKGLLEFYQEVEDKKANQKIQELLPLVNSLYQERKKFSIYLDSIGKKSAGLTQKEILRHDSQILHQEALWYLLEYHLQMYFELTQAQNREAIKKLVEKKENKISAGTLMGLREEIRRNEFLDILAYKIYNQELREKLILLFYTFRQQLQTSKDYYDLIKDYQNFLKNLLKILKDQGIKKVSSMIFSPYGQEPTITKLLKII